MTIAKDYFGHEINKGDVVLYNERASKGYHSSFTEGIIVGFNKLNTVSVIDYEYLFNKLNTVSVIDYEYLEEFKTGGYHYLIDCKFPMNVVNLTALGIRERVDL